MELSIFSIRIRLFSFKPRELIISINFFSIFFFAMLLAAFLSNISACFSRIEIIILMSSFSRGNTDTVFSIASSSDGVYLTSSSYNKIPNLFKRVGDTFTDISPATLTTNRGSGGSCLTPDGVYAAYTYDTSPYIAIYKRSADTFTKLADPTTTPTGSGYCTAFSADGVYLAVAHSTSPYITIYKRSGDTFTKLANPATLPASTLLSVAFSADGNYLFAACMASPYLIIYSRSGDTFTKLPDPANLPSSSARSVAITPRSFEGIV